MKSEPDEFSIEDLAAAPKKTTPWFGVRNYQARNYMRDAMRVGDDVLFYHSSCEVPGIYGLAKVASKVASSGRGWLTVSCSSDSGSTARPRSARASSASSASWTSTDTRSG